MLKASLARRFIVFTSLLVLATSLSLSLFVLAHEQVEQDRQIRLRGMSLARNLAYNAELGVLTRNRDLLHDLAVGLLRESDVLSVTVTDTEGAVLLEDSMEDGAASEELVASTEGATRELAMLTSIRPFTSRGSGRIEAYEIRFPVLTNRRDRQNEEIGFLLDSEPASSQSEVIGHVRIRLSLAAMHDDLAELKLALGLLTFLVITIAVVLTVALVQRMVAPLRALAAATREIAEGHLAEVTVEASPDEIGQLAESFNRMTAELGRSQRDLERHSSGLEEQVRRRTEELETAQGQLVQAEKMSAVGLLVSGVAHELNNPLAGVIGFSQLLLRSDMDEQVRRKLERINRDAERCKKIVQNLQTFARKHKPEKEYVGVNGIIEQTLELRSYQLNLDNIRVVTDLEPNLPKTMADFHQLQRVFLNIIINAHQAMAGRDHGGDLVLVTRSQGDKIVIRIRDSGPGIAPENLGKLFDPFFTTKEVGQGTGLGLSICYGIVEEHKGRLSAENSEEGGALFTVQLPIIPREEGEHDGPDRTNGVVGQDVPRKNILIVDDEAAIIEVLFEVLRSDGHRVDTAVNGEVAWRKIREEAYDVIISDLRMPGMSGQELYARIREWDPSLCQRIIFSTGDVLSSETHGFLNDSGNNYLQKPFELDAIREVVNAVLEN